MATVTSCENQEFCYCHILHNLLSGKFKSIKAWFHDSEILREKLFMRNTDGCTWIIPLNSLFASKKVASPVSRIQFYSLRRRKKWENLIRPDSTTAKYFARNCLCEIRMVGHEWFYWILSLFSPSQWVELNSTHWRSEFFAREDRIQWNYSCATIRISHKQFLAKYFAVVESGL